MKKIFTFAVILALFLETLALPLFALDNDLSDKSETLETYSAEILPVKGGASAIATMTFDDGEHQTVSTLVPLLEEYGLKASLMVGERAQEPASTLCHHICSCPHPGCLSCAR